LVSTTTGTYVSSCIKEGFAMKRLGIALILILIAVLSGCAARYQNVMVPPRIDLTQHEIIGVSGFDSTNEGQLGPLATRRFTDLARRDQGLVRMMDVDFETDQRNPTAYRELGEQSGASTIFVGSLEVSDIRPNLSIAHTLKSGQLTANVDAMLTVELIETATGASIWSSSARATRTIGQITMLGRRRSGPGLRPVDRRPGQPGRVRLSGDLETGTDRAVTSPVCCACSVTQAEGASR
jgi:hypothetical protein